jgi:hypothetical protein
VLSPTPVTRPLVRRKAAAVIDSLYVAREMFGEEALASMISRLEPGARAFCERKLLTVEWIDYAAWFPFNVAVHRELCGGDDLRFRRFIRKVAERGFSTVYRMFIRLPSTDFVVDRATKIWGTLFDGGELRVKKRERDGDVRRIVIALDVPLPEPLFGVIVCEVMELLATMNGSKSITSDAELAVKDGVLSGEIRLAYHC